MKTPEFKELLTNVNNSTYTQTLLKISTDPFYEEAEEYRLKDEQGLLLVEAIKNNKYITEVNLCGNNLSDITAIALASVTSLKNLDLGHNRITIKGAIALAASNLTKLSLYNNNIKVLDSELTDTFIFNKSIIDLNLDSVTIPSARVTELIKYNSNIQSLVLGSGLTDEAFKFIGENKVIQKIIINYSELTDNFTEYLSNNYSIKKFSSYSSKISDQGALLLSKHPSLRELKLENSNITVNGSKHFFNSKLEKVIISNGAKHDFMSPQETKDFNAKFKDYQKTRLKEQEEYYNYITNNKQYPGINPDMNNFDSIQVAIDLLQYRWSTEDFEQKMIGEVDDF